VSPADKLRTRVVTLVLGAIIGLAFLLYGSIIALLWRAGPDVDALKTAIPGELWLAAGLFGGGLIGLLNNSKGGSEGGHSADPADPLVVTADEPLPVHQVDRPSPLSPVLEQEVN
jgi:hypothetical protein